MYVGVLLIYIFERMNWIGLLCWWMVWCWFPHYYSTVLDASDTVWVWILWCIYSVPQIICYIIGYYQIRYLPNTVMTVITKYKLVHVTLGTMSVTDYFIVFHGTGLIYDLVFNTNLQLLDTLHDVNERLNVSH